jgi:hypothetical protein
MALGLQAASGRGWRVDLVAEPLELADEAAAVALGVLGITAVEELFAELVVGHAALEDAVGGGEDLVSGRDRGLGVPAAALDALADR